MQTWKGNGCTHHRLFISTLSLFRKDICYRSNDKMILTRGKQSPRSGLATLRNTNIYTNDHAWRHASRELLYFISTDPICSIVDDVETFDAVETDGMRSRNSSSSSAAALTLTSAEVTRKMATSSSREEEGEPPMGELKAGEPGEVDGEEMASKRGSSSPFSITPESLWLGEKQNDVMMIVGA